MADQEKKETRRPYTRPTLKTFGSLAQVTQMVGSMGLRDGGSKSTARTR